MLVFLAVFFFSVYVPEFLYLFFSVYRYSWLFFSVFRFSWLFFFWFTPVFLAVNRENWHIFNGINGIPIERVHIGGPCQLLIRNRRFSEISKLPGQIVLQTFRSIYVYYTVGKPLGTPTFRSKTPKIRFLFPKKYS